MTTVYTRKNEPILVDADVAEKLKGRCIYFLKDLTRPAKSSYPQIVLLPEEREYDGQKQLGLARWILGLGSIGKTNLYVDHINHNTADNRRDNLRVVTNSVNVTNLPLGKKQGNNTYRGVTQKSDNCWLAHITRDKKTYRVYLSTEVQATIAYNIMCEATTQIDVPNDIPAEHWLEYHMVEKIVYARYPQFVQEPLDLSLHAPSYIPQPLNLPVYAPQPLNLPQYTPQPLNQSSYVPEPLNAFSYNPEYSCLQG